MVKTNGSRNPTPPGAVQTGRESEAQMRRSGDPYARQIVPMPLSSVTPVYTAVGTPPSSTTHPDQHPAESGPPGVGRSAIGSIVQDTRSALLA